MRATEALIARWDALVDARGSTRAVGLLRALLPLLIWARWADELQPFRGTGPAWWLLSALFFTTTTAMFVGWRARAATIATAATLIWMNAGWGWFGDQRGWTHHHTWLLMGATVWLTLTPCDRSLSLDRWLAVRRAERDGSTPPPEQGALWAVPILAMQTSAVYLWSAYDKLTWGFLSGERLQAILMHFTSGSEPVSVPGFATLCAIAAVLTVAIELVLPVGLFVRRWQPVLVPLGLAFHGLLYVSIPVGTFSLTMAALYLTYLHPDDVHRAIDRLFGYSTTAFAKSSINDS